MRANLFNEVTIAYYKTISMLYEKLPVAMLMLNNVAFIEQGGMNLQNL